MKGIVRRFLSLVLCMCMVMALLPNVIMTAFAATSDIGVKSMVFCLRSQP